jgi:hypothetical protein
MIRIREFVPLERGDKENEYNGWQFRIDVEGIEIGYKTDKNNRGLYTDEGKLIDPDFRLTSKPGRSRQRVKEYFREKLRGVY